MSWLPKQKISAPTTHHYQISTSLSSTATFLLTFTIFLHTLLCNLLISQSDGADIKWSQRGRHPPVRSPGGKKNDPRVAATCNHQYYFCVSCYQEKKKSTTTHLSKVTYWFHKIASKALVLQLGNNELQVLWPRRAVVLTRKEKGDRSRNVKTFQRFSIP